MPHKRAKRSVREQQRKGRGADLAPPGDNSGNGMGISTERIPKSAARVLDAAKVRAEYKQKKRALEGGLADTNTNDHTDGASKPPPHKKRRADAGAGAEKGRALKTKGNTQAIEIQPGESLKHFNRRVEDHMRPLVQSAMRASASTQRKERKAATAPSQATATKNVSKTQQTPSSSDTRRNPKASVKDARRDNDDDDDNEDDNVHRPKEFAVVSSAAPRRLNDIAMAPPELKRFPRGVKTKTHKSLAGASTGVLSMSQRVMMEAERESAIKRYREMKERKTKEADRTLLTV